VPISLSASGVGAVLKGDWGFYSVLDQQIWKLGSGEDAAKGAALFLRVAGAPNDRNTIDFYIDGGLSFSGLVPGRSDDAFGVGLAYAHVSDVARGFDLDSGEAVLRRAEAALELTYQAQIVPGWSIQPGLPIYLQPRRGRRRQWRARQGRRRVRRAHDYEFLSLGQTSARRKAIGSSSFGNV
jgi:porin